MPPSLFRRRQPRLSVVVPVYDVEDYLEECLDSLAAQTFGPLEVVIVDDGSTDGSAAIAARYADKHRHWTLVRTDNHGLGAARNRGVRHATAEYLTFVDSDDVVPPDAYQVMVSTLDESGSDFVVGGVRQLAGSDLVEPVFLRTATARRRIAITAGDLPEITRNVFAWNKVFRRSFYDRAGIEFPEAVRYEDQPATMRAYLLAERFDVVARPVYHWRVRDAGTSITQGRALLADLEDRLTSKSMVSQTVRDLGTPAVQEFWGRTGVVGDLPVYFAQIPAVDDTYWRRLVSGLRELLEGWPPIEDCSLRLPQRLIGWLVLRDRRADAERVVRWLAENPGPLRLQVAGDRVVPLDLPVASDPAGELPDGVRRLGGHELEFDARLVDVGWEDDVLVVTGWALIRGAPTAGVSTQVRARLQGRSGGAAVVGDVSRFVAPAATAWIDRGEQRYDDSGFVARFDLHRWLTADPTAGADPEAGSGDELTMSVEVDVASIHGEGLVRSLTRELDPARLSDASVRTGAVVQWRPGSGLVVRRG